MSGTLLREIRAGPGVRSLMSAVSLLAILGNGHPQHMHAGGVDFPRAGLPGWSTPLIAEQEYVTPHISESSADPR